MEEKSPTFCWRKVESFHRILERETSTSTTRYWESTATCCQYETRGMGGLLEGQSENSPCEETVNISVGKSNLHRDAK